MRHVRRFRDLDLTQISCVFLTPTPPLHVTRQKPQTTTTKPKTSTRRRTPPGFQTLQESVDTVKAILRKTGRPMQFAEIWDEFERQQIKIYGKDPKKVLSARISDGRKADVFIRVDDGLALPEWQTQTTNIETQKEDAPPTDQDQGASSGSDNSTTQKEGVEKRNFFLSE